MFFRSEVITPEVIRPNASPIEVVQKAIASPLGKLDSKSFPLDKRLTAAIAVNDKTRPVPHEFLLPPLLNYLQSSLGIKNLTFSLSLRPAPMPPCLQMNTN